MKFTSKIAALLASAMLLGACSSNTSGDNVLASIDPDTKIVANDVYSELLKTNSGKSAIYQYIIKEVVENNFPVTDAMTTEADLNVKGIQNQYVSYYGAQSDAYLAQALKQSGFKDLEDYRSTLIYSFQLKEFLGQYVDNHFDEVFEDYFTTKNPRYVSHILVKMVDPAKPTEEEQKKLDTVQSLIDSGKDFAEIAKEYSDDTSASMGGELGICDTDTNFVTEFKEVALKLKEGEISKATKSQYGYHFITVTSADKEQMKKDPQILEERLLSYDNYMIYTALENFELTFEDDAIKEIFESQLKASLDKRDAARKESAK